MNTLPCVMRFSNGVPHSLSTNTCEVYNVPCLMNFYPGSVIVQGEVWVLSGPGGEGGKCSGGHGDCSYCGFRLLFVRGYFCPFVVACVLSMYCGGPITVVLRTERAVGIGILVICNYGIAGRGLR